MTIYNADYDIDTLAFRGNLHFHYNHLFYWLYQNIQSKTFFELCYPLVILDESMNYLCWIEGNFLQYSKGFFIVWLRKNLDKLPHSFHKVVSKKLAKKCYDFRHWFLNSISGRQHEERRGLKTARQNLPIARRWEPVGSDSHHYYVGTWPKCGYFSFGYSSQIWKLQKRKRASYHYLKRYESDFLHSTCFIFF